MSENHILFGSPPLCPSMASNLDHLPLLPYHHVLCKNAHLRGWVYHYQQTLDPPPPQIVLAALREHIKSVTGRKWKTCSLTAVAYSQNATFRKAVSSRAGSHERACAPGSWLYTSGLYTSGLALPCYQRVTSELDLLLMCDIGIGCGSNVSHRNWVRYQCVTSKLDLLLMCDIRIGFTTNVWHWNWICY